jgi:gamma-glutamylcyclotransferase (GGCT)/AIG2-like uncharacterized protein YtfP
LIKPIRVAVYGSLKSGFGLHNVLKNHNAKLLGTDRIGYMLMWDLNAYPCIVPSVNMADSASIEVYEVTPECLKRLDATEGVESFHYERVPIETRLGEAFIYQYHPESTAQRLNTMRSARIVRSGNWTQPPVSELWSENVVLATMDATYRARVESCSLRYRRPPATNVVPFREVKALPAPAKPAAPVENSFDIGISFVEDTNHVDVSDSPV